LSVWRRLGYVSFMVVRPARLGALLQSIKDTPGTWQDRVPPGWAMGEAAPSRAAGRGSILTDYARKSGFGQKSGGCGGRSGRMQGLRFLCELRANGRGAKAKGSESGARRWRLARSCRLQRFSAPRAQTRGDRRTAG
jgi:hypothetical protein